MKRYEENNDIKENIESKYQSKSRKVRIKPLVSYYLKRIINSLTILQGIMTFCFLIFYFQNVINLNIIVFYLYLSIIIFIAYSFLIFGIHFLEKPEIEDTIPEATETLEEITEIKPEITEDFFQGKTLQVYWYFFTKRHAGVREIQKALNISSSGTVSYQITKLLKAGIISKNEEEGKYSLKENVKIGILKFFIRIGS
ncbi:MAG: winged helix-turn-helix domain-containing protein, partial [Candidatus Thorarchaeota archaeon]